MMTNMQAADRVFHAANRGLESGYKSYVDAVSVLTPCIDDSWQALNAVDQKDRRTQDLLAILGRARSGGKKLLVGIKRDRALRNAYDVVNSPTWTPSDRAAAMLKIANKTARAIVLKTTPCFVAATLQQTLSDLGTLAAGDAPNPFGEIQRIAENSRRTESSMFRSNPQLKAPELAAALRPALLAAQSQLNQVAAQLGATPPKA